MRPPVTLTPCVSHTNVDRGWNPFAFTALLPIGRRGSNEKICDAAVPPEVEGGEAESSGHCLPPMGWVPCASVQRRAAVEVNVTN